MVWFRTWNGNRRLTPRPSYPKTSRLSTVMLVPVSRKARARALGTILSPSRDSSKLSRLRQSWHSVAMLVLVALIHPQEREGLPPAWVHVYSHGQSPIEEVVHGPAASSHLRQFSTRQAASCMYESPQHPNPSSGYYCILLGAVISSRKAGFTEKSRPLNLTTSFSHGDIYMSVIVSFNLGARGGWRR